MYYFKMQTAKLTWRRRHLSEIWLIAGFQKFLHSHFVGFYKGSAHVFCPSSRNLLCKPFRNVKLQDVYQRENTTKKDLVPQNIGMNQRNQTKPYHTDPKRIELNRTAWKWTTPNQTQWTMCAKFIIEHIWFSL